MPRTTTNFLIVALACNIFGCASIPVAEKEYRQIIKDTETENIDFSFMKLRQYLNKNPDSPYIKDIRFAIAEYYFQIKDYRDAVNELTRYTSDYRDDKNTIFAYILLYKIMLEYKTEPQLLEKIKEKFFSKSLLLIFADSKIAQYKSVLNNAYKIVEHIDSIEVFRNNELFLMVAS